MSGLSRVEDFKPLQKGSRHRAVRQRLDEDFYLISLLSHITDNLTLFISRAIQFSVEK
jgi:hypothetical protein